MGAIKKRQLEFLGIKTITARFFFLTARFFKNYAAWHNIVYL